MTQRHSFIEQIDHIGIQALVLRVRSLEQAQAALLQRQLSWKAAPGRLSLTVPDSGGLAVQLVEGDRPR